jgi:acetyl-CoA carboxylase biotin carboxyl carrier protein
MVGNGPGGEKDVFDVRKIRRLVELMKEHDLGEIDLRQGETRIKLRRMGSAAPLDLPAFVSPATPAAGQNSPTPVPAPAPAPAPELTQAGKAETDDANIVVIRSPMVGTFYAAPDPDSPPYVKVGDHVGPETTVCIIEAMKVFNQIPAEASGKIVAVLVDSGEPVEYGQPLFKLDTRG